MDHVLDVQVVKFLQVMEEHVKGQLLHAKKTRFLLQVASAKPANHTLSDYQEDLVLINVVMHAVNQGAVLIKS